MTLDKQKEHKKVKSQEVDQKEERDVGKCKRQERTKALRDLSTKNDKYQKRKNNSTNTREERKNGKQKNGRKEKSKKQSKKVRTFFHIL